MENSKTKESLKFQGDILNLCDFIQVYVFTTNHHLKWLAVLVNDSLRRYFTMYRPIFQRGGGGGVEKEKM